MIFARLTVILCLISPNKLVAAPFLDDKYNGGKHDPDAAEDPYHYIDHDQPFEPRRHLGPFEFACGKFSACLIPVHRIAMPHGINDIFCGAGDGIAAHAVAMIER